MPSPQEQIEGFTELEKLGAIKPEEQKQLDSLRIQHPDIQVQPQIDESAERSQLSTQRTMIDDIAGDLSVEEETIDDGRSFTSLGTEMGFQIVGSTTGAIAGGKVNRPAQGAALGASGAEGLFQMLQNMAPQVGIDKEVFGEPPSTSEEALGKIGTAGAFDLTGGAIATTLKGQLNKFNPLAKATPDDIRVLEVIEKNVGDDIPISLIAPGSKGAAIIENVGGGSFLSPGLFKQQRVNITTILQEGIRAQARSITKGRSAEQIGKTVTSILKNKVKAMSKSLDDIAVRVDLMGGSAVRVNNPIKFLKDEFATVTVGLKAKQELKIFSKILGEGGENVTKFGKNDLIPFRNAQELVNDLTEDIVKLSGKKGKSLFGADNASKLTGRLTTLRRKIVDSMARRIKGVGDPILSRAFRTMENIKFQGHVRYNEKLLVDIMKSNDTAASVILNKIKSPLEMRRIKHLVGHAEWRKMEGLAYQSVIKKSTARKGGKQIISGDRILEQMDNFDDSLKGVIFNKATRKNFEELAEALAVTQGDKASNIGTVFMELTQAGAITSMLFGGISPANALILVGPAALEKIFTSPKIMRAMISATKNASSGTLGSTGAAIAGILGLLTKHGIDYVLEDDPFMRSKDAMEKTQGELMDTLGDFSID